MGIKLGDIDVAKEMVELNFQLRRTQKLLEILINRVPAIGGPLINQGDIDAAETDALDFVQQKFPNMGVKIKK